MNRLEQQGVARSPVVVKKSHKSVRYGQGNMEEHCSNCTHYQRTNHCELVVDPIHPKGWCKLWGKTNR